MYNTRIFSKVITLCSHPLQPTFKILPSSQADPLKSLDSLHPHHPGNHESDVSIGFQRTISKELNPRLSRSRVQNSWPIINHPDSQASAAPGFLLFPGPETQLSSEPDLHTAQDLALKRQRRSCPASCFSSPTSSQPRGRQSSVAPREHRGCLEGPTTLRGGLCSHIDHPLPTPQHPEAAA